MKILCLDIGTKMGWAISDGSIIRSGTENFKAKSIERPGIRFLKFKNWLTDLKSKFGAVDRVHYEQVMHHAGIKAGHVYGGFLGVLQAWCEHHGIPYSGVGVTTIKKHATGFGHAKKHHMIKAMKSKGHKPSDDNEADALALLHCVQDGVA
jgi:crossover junction endodeoxyribonuclease RuvC